MIWSENCSPTRRPAAAFLLHVHRRPSLRCSRYSTARDFAAAAVMEKLNRRSPGHRCLIYFKALIPVEQTVTILAMFQRHVIACVAASYKVSVAFR